MTFPGFNQPRSRILTSLEIGTSKVVALVGEVDAGRSLNLVGFGKVPSRGVSKGVITDLKLASECAHDALSRAEQTAGVKSDDVFLAISGGHIGGFATDATVNVASPDGVVRRDDVINATNQAKQKRPPQDHSVIHYVRRQFRLDGKVVLNPEAMKGERLSASYWIVHGRTNVISDAIRIVNGFNLRVTDIVFSALASAAMVTTPDERKHGVLVVDIGSGTTDFVLYRNGSVEMTGVIPVGGDHLSNDLSLALRVSLAQAEALKLRAGTAVVQSRDRAEKVWVCGDQSIGDRQVFRHAVEKVLSVRVEETFEILRKRLGPALLPDTIAAGVVLTGGGVKLPQMDQVASRVLGLPVRIGENPEWVIGDLRGQEFSTALGVLYYGMNNPGERGAVRRPAGLFDRLLEKLKIA